jgi:hypothetical protein
MIAELSASANGHSYEAGSSSSLDILQLEVADPRLLRLAQAQVSTAAKHSTLVCCGYYSAVVGCVLSVTRAARSVVPYTTATYESEHQCFYAVIAAAAGLIVRGYGVVVY